MTGELLDDVGTPGWGAGSSGGGFMLVHGLGPVSFKIHDAVSQVGMQTIIKGGFCARRLERRLGR